jgi:hypothetical protein
LTAATRPIPPVSRGVIVAIAFVFAATWGYGATLPLGTNGYPPTSFDLLMVVTFSVMLAELALVAWLVPRLAPPDGAIRSTAWLLGIGAIVASLGNLGEDALLIGGSEYLYGFGLFGAFIGLATLTAALARRRQGWLALLVLLTLVGIIVMAGHGPPVLPFIWLGVAALAVRSS